MKLGEIFVELVSKDKKFKASLKDAEGKSITTSKKMQKSFDGLNFDRASRSTQVFGNQISKITKLIGAMVVASAGITLFKSIKVGANFEQQMAKVRGITNATVSEFVDLTKIAKELGATTEWSATQAAQGLEFLAMAGFSAEKAIKALPGVLDLATAGAIDLGRAADIASNALTAMRLPVEQLSRVNDVFVATITSSNVNMEMMAEAFKYSAPLAAAYGMEIETLAGLIGMLGNAGIQGSMAGTQLAFSFQKLQKVFDKYGVSAIKADGSSKSLIDALELLQSSGASASEVMEVFGVRAGRAALALLGQGVPAIKTYIKKIEDAAGSTSKLANIMRDTLSGDIKTLKSTLEDLAISGFEEYGASLRSFIQEITEYFRNNKEEIIELTVSIGKVAEDLGRITLLIGALGGETLKAWNKLPQPVREVGLIVAIVGGKPAIKAIALITLLNSQLSKLSMGLGDLGKAFYDFGEYAQNIEDVLTGKKDWSTGAIKNVEDLTTAFVALYTAQGIVWVERGDMDAYLASLNKIDDATKDVAGSTVDLGNVISDKLKKELEKVNKELEKFYDKLEKSKESIAKFFRVELISDPQMRKVEELKIKFEELEKQIYATFAGEELKAQLANLSKWYGMEYEEIVKITEETTKEVDELWIRAMDRVQSTMADTFMDAMKGKLNSFKDIFKSFCDVLLRYWAEMLAKMVMQSNILQGITSSLGGIFGGMFGGGGGGGTTGQTAAQAAMIAGHGPVSEEWALAQGFKNTAQGASAAWSLKGAYGAYGAAGGGWAGMQAGAGSLFGGIGSGISGISWTGWAAIAYFASELLSGLNVKKGYGQLTYAPHGYGYGGEFQPTSPFQGDFGTDPLGTYIRGILGIDQPMAGHYFSAAIKESDWWEAMKALPATILEWTSPFVTMGLSALGLDMGKIFGFGNKKRSYYGKSFEFGEYSPETGWGEPLGNVYRDKRKGEKAFGESGESMAQSGRDLINMLDSVFKDLLGIFGENWENLFTTKMIDLAALGLSFDFYISAEDKGEFKDDWKKSWQAMAEGLIEPIVTIGTDLLKEALGGVVTDSSVWNYFTDDFKNYLTEALENSLADLQIDWSQVTDQEGFEAALEQMGMAAENIAAIVDHFDKVNTIMESISDVIEMRGLSTTTQNAINQLRSINTKFDQLAATLKANGVDLEKYTDLEKVRLLTISDAIEAMMRAGISSEDLTFAIQYMADGMTAAGHSIEDVTAAVTAAWLAAADAASAYIAGSFGDAIEQIKTSMMSQQSLYDYYSSQVAQLEQLLSTLTDPAAIQQTMSDILRYTMAAWGMLSPDQQQMYGPQFIQALEKNQKAAEDLLEKYRDSFKANEEKLVNTMNQTVQAVLTAAGAQQAAAGAQQAAAGTQQIAANTQLAASQIPVQVILNLSGSDVG